MAGIDMMTPSDVAQRRRYAQALMEQGTDASPVGHWTQALARVVQGGLGGYQMGQANRGEQEGMASGNKALAQALAGGNFDEAMQNPYVSDRATDLRVAQYNRGIEQNDPMRKLEADLKRAQIQKLQRGPEPTEAPSNVREWEYFSKLPPEQQQQYLTMRRNPQYLDAADQYLRPNQLQPGQTIDAVPKNVAGAEQQKVLGREAGERQAAAPKALSAMQAADAKSDVVLSTIAEARSMVGPMTAGFGGSMLSNVPGTGARNLAAKIDTLKANAGFQELQAMRDNSPTGGALGQVAVQELAMLQATITSLEQAQTPEQLTQALDAYEKFVRESKVRRKLAYDMTYGQSGGAPQPPAAPQGNDGWGWRRLD